MPDGRGATATAAEPEDAACEQERVGGGAAIGHGGCRQRLAEVGNTSLWNVLRCVGKVKCSLWIVHESMYGDEHIRLSGGPW